MAIAAPSRAALARLLVVDDDEGVRGFLALALRDEGYAVTTAADGYDAIRSAREDPPDLILLDLMVPALDGWSFLDIYRQAPGPKAPIIVVTGVRAAEYAVAYAAPRVEEVLHKPISIDRLLDTVRHHLGVA